MTIEEIKSRLRIQDVLAHYGIEPNKNKHINCPFHEDKTPSMKVYAETNTVYCFSGNCATHGSSLDVIEFVMQMEGGTKRQAILKCKALLGHIEPMKGELRAMDQVWKSLQQSLGRSEKAKSYLKNRGLSTKGVGYHSGQLHKGKLAKEAKSVGLINEQNKPWAANCVLYPLKDALDKVVSLYGRSLTTGHFYLSGRCGLYPSYPSKKAKQIILTESIIDATSLLEIKALKDYEVLALYGTNGLTEEHKKALESCGDLEEIILLLDGDAAGAKASKKYQVELQQLLPKVSTRIVELPNNTDINELWANHLSEAMFVELLQVEKPKSLENKLNTANPNNLIYQGMHAVYYVKGFSSLKNLDSLKVTLVTELEHKKSRGKVEMYEDTAVQKYCRTASQKLGINEDLLDLDISLLTDELEAYRASFESAESMSSSIVKNFQISAEARKQAKAFLSHKNLFQRLNTLIGKTGIVGEENTRLLLLIVASSYKCKDPLHALIQGSSGTGKTLLLRKIMDMIPEQDRHIWTRISDKSLYHAGTKFKHSSIAVEDWDGLSEEVQYVVREMQSGKRLSSTITQKQANGKMENVEILAEGPISTLMCTTRGAVYEDNMSRCLLVAVDESEEQTERILDYQYQKDRGEIDHKTELAAINQLQNMVYLLEPKSVVNPFAGKIQLPKRVHKIRRLNHLFQCFVKQITWLHQLQREVDNNGRIITTKEDIQLAINLLFETIILKVDELDGSLRQFFEQLKEYIQGQEEQEKHCFGRREIRQALGVRKSQLHNYIRSLLDLEYLKQVGGYSNKGFRYQIVYWDDNKALRKGIQNDLTEQLKAL
ncbi:toprim domain-containing protein [Aureispira sp. CCB-E]|uniref:toprim domain-containing protein n=1 Tax=Aureispira sp. CCB-E TaxID=3051121 RepID=UPI0028692FA8|nr:toprim domain-containing protein [Aureispira sp. CCB-E]WMX17584.1 toprim domain-containing protein [Aureispira sp. CCB-E]WMX17590.1 toprim domain-containing protein [Aureispira sp. CCB-E]